MKYRIANWHQYRFYKEKRPTTPWLMLSYEVFDSAAWNRLSDTEARMLMELLRFADGATGELPAFAELMWRLLAKGRFVSTAVSMDVSTGCQHGC